MWAVPKPLRQYCPGILLHLAQVEVRPNATIYLDSTASKVSGQPTYVHPEPR